MDMARIHDLVLAIDAGLGEKVRGKVSEIQLERFLGVERMHPALAVMLIEHCAIHGILMGQRGTGGFCFIRTSALEGAAQILLERKGLDTGAKDG